MSLRSNIFYKSCHKSSLITAKKVSELWGNGALDANDVVSLVFLMSDEHQLKDMYNLLQHLELSKFQGLDMFKILHEFSDWEMKLFEALNCIDNKLALFKLNINLVDATFNKRHGFYSLSESRVLLYRICEKLDQSNFSNFVAAMEKLGAPGPDKNSSFLELYFMFWHVNGFVNMNTHDGFQFLTEALCLIDQSPLAVTLNNPFLLHHNSIFDDDHPIEMYPIKNPGFCLIINEVSYGGNGYDRTSSIVNVEQLKKVMALFNFIVIDMEDVSGPELCDTIKQIVKKHFKQHSVLLLIIMAHGGPGYIYCPNLEVSKEELEQSLVVHTECIDSNKQPTPVSQPLKIFNTDSPLLKVSTKFIQNCLFECDVLQRIPKVVIFNACRGEQDFSNKEYFKSDLAADSTDAKTLSHMDILTCYSSLPKYASYRDKVEGSLFINVFCDVLSKRQDIEICELFTLINARLMQPSSVLSAAFLPGRAGKEKGLANPFEFTSSLTKKLYFKIPET